MKQPNFKLGDIVSFEVEDKVKTGSIYIVDARGTFQQSEEPSYDIMVHNEQFPEGCLYKHIRESWVTTKNTTKMDEIEQLKQDEAISEACANEMQAYEEATGGF